MLRAMRRVPRPLAAVVGLAVLALSGCASNAPQDTFKAKGPDAREIGHLTVAILIVAGVVGLLVGLAVIFVTIRFRAGRFSPEDVPAQVHGNTKLEIGWTIAPAVILAIVAVPTVTTIFNLADTKANSYQVSVIGQQWWWEFDYPQANVVTANVMVIPAGKPVELSITSRDVIHSFWVPRLNGKKDAVPGRVHKWRIQADDPGEFWGQCAEFCGLSHANMRIRVRALPQAEFDAWIASQRKDATPIADDATNAASRGQALFTAQCARCHQVNGITGPVDASTQLVSGAAPNLTHLMDKYRNVFAGGTFDLRDPKTGELNRTNLEAWLRNAPAMKPMYPDPIPKRGILGRGMPNLNLSESQIDDLVAFLTTLK